MAIPRIDDDPEAIAAADLVDLAGLFSGGLATPVQALEVYLARIARLQLARLGVTAVYGADACTHRDATRYFSHRRDARTGRQATLIWRVGAEDG